MQDKPDPDDILAAIAVFLRGTVMPQASPRIAFQTRVAAGALDLVRRQIALGPPAEAAELDRLRALLGQDGSLADLNAGLADGLDSGVLDLATPGVAAHLWASTLEKLAVDQPNYSGYRAALAAQTSSRRS
jgi:hypothetical protein